MPQLNLTSQSISSLTAPKVRTDYFDQKVTGLGLRVSPSGTKTWICMFRVPGDPRKRRMTLGRYPAISLADARTQAREMLLAASRGDDPGEEKQQLLGAPAFAELASEYIEKHAKKNKRSWKEDERILGRDVLPVLGSRKVHEVKRRDVIRLLDAIVDRGAPIQANRTLALVRKIFNWAISRDIVETNPCLQVKAPRKENQRDRVLKEDELRAVWRAFDKLGAPMGQMFKLRLLTAQRGGEVASMAWTDVDLAGGWWTIPAERAKNGRSHRVPLSKPARDILAARQPSRGEWVFPSPTRTGQYIQSPQKAAQRARTLSGVEDFVLHDLRRTAASYMTSLGVPRLVVSKILNHAEQGVTHVYDRHAYDAEKREALDLWASRLQEITQDNPNGETRTAV